MDKRGVSPLFHESGYVCTNMQLLYHKNCLGSILSLAKGIQSYDAHPSPTCGLGSDVFLSPWKLYHSAKKNSRLTELASNLGGFLLGSQLTS